MKEDDDGDEDYDATDSLFFALNHEHIHQEESTFVDPSCLLIIGNCLKLCWEANKIDLSFRTKFYWAIVEPLIKSYDSYDFVKMKPAEIIERVTHSRDVPSNPEIYVVRVARDAKRGAEGLSMLKQFTAQAIRHAVDEWDIDIVSMSFGFSEEVLSIRDAIEYADRVKEGKVLFFAAANNAGQNELELFPEFIDSIISVRGTDYNGNFEPRYNPPSWPYQEGYLHKNLLKDVGKDKGKAR
ncbi:hypothetical protein G7Z17_g10559 [Cylindrodendrum hubeiense]|uniref:Peptidase S8/S53 domain-containing protein n=1 Tax=Cylindrodendrum hubeiense TaxID=595255 RepID=A0A9P5H2S1_9HYPO|nr:hypothetical protein G7Z17_g10559 [Cylindrodendrum hubeiense]